MDSSYRKSGDQVSELNVDNISWESLAILSERRINLSVNKSSIIYQTDWNGNPVIVKHFHEGSKELAEREALIVGRCKHNNIIKLMAAGPDFPTNYNFLVFEYADSLSLYDILYNLQSIYYDLINVLHWIKQISLACDYLHRLCDPPIIHGDIKPSNILAFSNASVVKVGDFGSATNLFSEITLPTGTLCYMAPERLTIRKDEKIFAHPKSDVYSLSVTFWELLARQQPHRILKRAVISDKFWSSIHKRLPCLNGCPKLLNDLIQRGWASDPNQRPTMLQITNLVDQLIRKLFPIDEQSSKGIKIQDPILSVYQSELNQQRTYSQNIVNN